ncbi:MAG: hypothetical protein V3U83_00470 [Acidobacteriota bacterium]
MRRKRHGPHCDAAHARSRRNAASYPLRMARLEIAAPQWGPRRVHSPSAGHLS